VVGILQAGAPDGWGHGVLVFDAATPGTSLARPIVVAGRLPDPAAADEVVLGERAARFSGIRAGDVVELASWSQEELDAAVDTGMAPTTRPFESTVVGIVRYLIDVESPGEPGLVLPDGMYAGPAWAAAHHADLAGYAMNVGVHLRDGTSHIEALQEALNASGWLASIDAGQ